MTEKCIAAGLTVRNPAPSSFRDSAGLHELFGKLCFPRRARNVEFLEFGASFATLTMEQDKQCCLDCPLFFFKFCCFFLVWDPERYWILRIIQQVVAVCLHSAVLPFHIWRLSLLDRYFCSAL